MATQGPRRPLLPLEFPAAPPLGGDRILRSWEIVDRTGSTNADLAARARAGEPAGLVLVAEEQVTGRGRLARSWVAPPRSSIAVSVLLAPRAPAERWGWLSLLAGVAVVRAITRVTGLSAVLKWPNDVLVPVPGAPREEPDRLGKVCGILAEVVAGPTGPLVVLGVGINVDQDASELPVVQATSLRLAGASTTDRDVVLRAYLEELSALYSAWDDADGRPETSGLGEAYRRACTTIGRQVRIQVPNRPALVGQCTGVDDHGRLVVRSGDGTTQVLAAGDVVHVRPGGTVTTSSWTAPE